tara:strand:- start:166 stop:525 length:360 start_codon:yes stop_codon:yes gene_type:complete
VELKVNMETRTCTTCNKEVDIDKLEKNGKDRFGNQRYRPQCKECRQKHKRGSYAAKKEAGSIPQGEKCPICGRDSEVIDHDHKTDKFRGYTCDRCNRGLGQFLDDSDLLKKAYEYLKRS